ncbi:MAG: hypothetical protein KDI50_04630 [Candidatus Competibacteraceae bacterium]|nr:hypothetical protein [Candidatus Competibacteraceae bacterium]
MSLHEFVMTAPVADQADAKAEHRSFSRNLAGDIAKAAVVYLATSGALLAVVLPHYV